MDLNEIISKLSKLNEEFCNSRSFNKQESSWKLMTKKLYDYVKYEENNCHLISSVETLPKLHLKNMTAEQIWQQLEFQNAALLSDSVHKGSANDTSNLCLMVAKLSAGLDEEEESKSEKHVISDDEGVELQDEDEPEHSTKQVRFMQDCESNSEKGSESLQDDKDSHINESNDEFSEFSDLDADTFGDVALDGEETEDDEPPAQHKLVNQVKSNVIPKNFKSSFLDSQFFNLRESEWVADNDIIGKDGGDENIDFMEDIPDDDSGDDAKRGMYSDFFDPPDKHEPAVESEEEENVTQEQQKETVKKNSAFEAALEKERNLKENLEDEFYLQEKPWVLKGEVKKGQRPENSALEEPLEYTVGIRQKPIITEETTKNIEKLILSRIRSQAWDDVERRIKPDANIAQYKSKLILDQEKSKKSLAEIYEEEYIRKQKEEKSGVTSGGSVLLGPDEKVQEQEIHKEIRREMKDLFRKLEALSNYHFTPKFKPAEVKVVKNFAAITIEESTPTTASDATLLAPQEIVAPERGDPKGETEKSTTDRLRERRRKKHRQHLKAQTQQQKLKSQLKTKTKDGLMPADASLKVVQSALKKGQVKVLDGNEAASKSSSKFFSQLQDQVSSQTKKRKFEDKYFGGRKKKKEMTMSKLLL